MDEENNDDESKVINFHDMEIDERILKAIAKLCWLKPTLIQEKAIPLLLEGKDVLLKARTGSGKTGAFAIPVIQRILNLKQSEGGSGHETRALILAPSKELCRQIYNNFVDLTNKCSRDIKIVDISPQVDPGTQRSVLRGGTDVVVGTPGRALMHLKAANIQLKDTLKIVIIDEADLIFSLGYEDDLKAIIGYLPRVYQAGLASATLSEDVTSLKSLLLHNAVTLRLKEPGVAPVSQLVHYRLLAEEQQKALVLHTLFKLGLAPGRTIIFVNNVNKCYKLKLFLQHFEIPSCILNSELPAVTRLHALSQFNEGKYDIIITSDETPSLTTKDGPQKRVGKVSRDKESGCSRGIDFQNVSNIVNFDFPLSVVSYIHRVGRTARGSAKGTALSLVNMKEQILMEEVDKYLLEGLAIREESIFTEFQFNMREVEGLQYRVQEAWRCVTKKAIRETRLIEIRREILNSKKLKHYFKENPKDFQTLRHDRPVHIIKLDEHIANVPEYLVPPSLKNIPQVVKELRGKKKKRQNPASRAISKRYMARKKDPLSNMQILEETSGLTEEQQDAEGGYKTKRRKTFI